MSPRGKAWQAEVLEIIRSKSGAVSAYDVLEALRTTNPKVAPPTVYRALAGLTDDGHIHRLESMNAYIPCQCDDHHHASLLTICDDCGTVEETVKPDLMSSLATAVNETGFSASRHVIEIHGVCASCGDAGTTL